MLVITTKNFNTIKRDCQSVETIMDKGSLLFYVPSTIENSWLRVSLPWYAHS